MPATALNHFNQDIARAQTIVSHADPVPRGMLRSDLLRSAWMFAVGALDAYFCDAYTDIVAATIIAKSRQDTVSLPDFFYDIRFPVRAILEPYTMNENWRWRMAARKMMERENVLSLATVQTFFNKFFREAERFFGDQLLDRWIMRPDSKKRLFGTTRSAYNVLAPAEKATARRQAREQMQARYGMIFQRRHDCIHNCDRPKVAPQALHLAGTVVKVIQDIEFLVHRCDEHINTEFREFLARIGCSASTISQSGY
ncbi:MAG TPA: hypothetical protein VMG10_22335 [Gemmataceae bacterium]|nr:hypothetical protein [Gemmataceae bacterium]